MDEATIREVVRRVIQGAAAAPGRGPLPAIPLEASARHVHLTGEALAALFGPGATLGNKKDLSQPGEFLSDKRVKLVTPKGEIGNVAVLGPLRKAVQAEVSLTDCRVLGVDAPVNLSGNLAGAADVVLVGDWGVYEARGSVIAAKAHIHMRPQDAEQFGVMHGQSVCVRIKGKRPVVLEDVAVRVHEQYALALHVDFDEANACAASSGAQVEILGPGWSPPVGACAGAAAACGERLVTEAVAKRLAAGEEKTLRLARGAIITPAGRDVLNRAGVGVEFV